MTPRKLSDSDKYDIIALYRQPGETTATVAARYNVSNSTINRLLKSSLSPTEYENLIQEKRAIRFGGGEGVEKTESAEMDIEPETIAAPEKPVRGSVGRPKRSRMPGENGQTSDEATQLPLFDLGEPANYNPEESRHDRYEANAIAQMLGEDLLDEDDDEDEELEADFDEDEDEDDEDEDEEEDDLPIPRRNRQFSEAVVQVLPLSEASIPRTCYLVIDKAAELITRPLKDFRELGQIPAEEYQEPTLPVFDNHRVARRFSNRSQRVIKVPDGRMLQKMSPCLQAKGITRLLIDGQVYAL